jgi:hypothetical protein
MPVIYSGNFEQEFNNAKDPSWWDNFVNDLETGWDYYIDMLTPEWFNKNWTQEEVIHFNDCVWSFVAGYYIAILYVWMILL